MTWPIDVQALEQAMVRNCSPTLAALKPASLFTFPGSFTAEAPENQNEASARRQALLEAVKYCQRQVSNAGVAIRILAWKRCGALVYVYRPRELAAYLVDRRAAHPLENEGYRPGDLDACLDELSRRLQNRSSAGRCPLHGGWSGRKVSCRGPRRFAVRGRGRLCRHGPKGPRGCSCGRYPDGSRPLLRRSLAWLPRGQAYGLHRHLSHRQQGLRESSRRAREAAR